MFGPRGVLAMKSLGPEGPERVRGNQVATGEGRRPEFVCVLVILRRFSPLFGERVRASGASGYLGIPYHRLKSNSCHTSGPDSDGPLI